MKIIIFLLIYAVYYGAKYLWRWLNSKKVQDKLTELIFPQDVYRLWTTINWCDAGSARDKWLEEHPFESHPHPEAQRLLQIQIGAYMLWLDAHPTCKDNDHLKFLTDQMEDWVY